MPVGLELERGVEASGDDILCYWNSSIWVADLTATGGGAGDTGATNLKRGGGYRFLNITIPQGSTINSAHITFTASASRTETTVKSVFTGEDVNDAAIFTTLADYQARRGIVVGGANDNYITSDHVHWDSIGSWTAESTYDSPDLKTIIKEIVDRVGWTSGNDIVIFWDDHDALSSSTARRACYMYDGSSAKAASLYVDYTSPTGWTHISKLKGVAAASIAKKKGIAVASIAKIKGVAV